MEKTFKEQTHYELLDIVPQDDACIKAFLSAFCKSVGSIEISKKRLNLVLQLENYSQGLVIVELLQKLYPTEFELNIEQAKSGAKQGQQIVSLCVPSSFTKQILIDLCLMTNENEGLGEFIENVPYDLLEDEECKKAFLQGLYLACGSIYVPNEKKGGYHFEFQIENELYATQVAKILEEYSIEPKMSDRGEFKLVYIKDKDQIMKTLLFLNLADSALTLQGIINERETANNLNRAVICETANLDKTFAASSKHLQAIAIIEENIGFDNLPVQLRETIDARLNNEQASLQELADILGVTKSCLNHRLRKVLEMAEKYES